MKVAKKLYTKCLAILSGNERTIIVSTDFIGATPKITKDSFEKARRLGLRTELKNIIVSASHTHSGFGAIGEEDLVNFIFFI